MFSNESFDVKYLNCYLAAKQVIITKKIRIDKISFDFAIGFFKSYIPENIFY